NRDAGQDQDEQVGKALDDQTHQPQGANQTVDANPEPCSWQISAISPAAVHLDSNSHWLTDQECSQGSDNQEN
ncbi:unnamed protein product, partial [marine sediment metagenome]